MPRLKRKNADDNLMPPPGKGAPEWWARRIMAAMEAGAETVTRPPNSKRMPELLGMAQARKEWPAKHPGAAYREPRIID